MKRLNTKTLSIALSLTAALFAAGNALAVPVSTTLRITEADPTGSSEAYAFDWFEVTNTGSSAVNITGWSVDDSSSITTPVRGAINGITSIAAGESVILIESATGTTFTTNVTNFATAWFGGNLPVGLQIGSYTASGISFSASGDGVGLFDNASTPVLQAYVSFGATTATGGTVDNAAGINDVTGVASLVTARSVSGTNGAFLSAGNQIGSPGTIGAASVAPVPLPAAAWLLLSGLGSLGAAARRRRQTA